MPTRYRFVTLPDGSTVATPADVSDAELFDYMGVEPPAPAKPAGQKSDFIDDVQRGFGGLAGGIGSALRDTPFSGVGASMQDWGNEVVRNNPADYNSWRDIHGVGDALGFAGEKFGEALPQLTGAIGAGLLTGGGGAAAVLGGTTFAQQYGDTRQAQRDKGIEDKTRAALTALPAAALDALTGVGGKVAGGVARRALGTLGRDAVEETAKRGFFREVGKTALEEGLTEPTQQALQRYGSYDPLTGQQAYDEYITSSLAGAAVGGIAGGGLHPFQRGAAPRPNVDEEVSSGNPVDLMRYGAPDAEGQGNLFESLPENFGPFRQDSAQPVGVDQRLSDFGTQRRQLVNALQQAEESGNTDQFYKYQDQLAQFDQQNGPAMTDLLRRSQGQRAALNDAEPELSLGIPQRAAPETLSRSVWRQAPEGSQGNLFSPVPDAPGVDATAPTVPQIDGLTPNRLSQMANSVRIGNGRSVTAPANGTYGMRSILQFLRSGARVDDFGLKLAAKLSSSLSNGDVTGAQQLVDQLVENLPHANIQGATIDQRIETLTRAQDIIDTYSESGVSGYNGEGAPMPSFRDAAGNVSRSMVPPTPGATVGEAAPGPEGTVSQMQERNAADSAAQAQTSLESSIRRLIIERAAKDPDIEDLEAHVGEELKRRKMNPALRPSEREMVARARPQPEVVQGESSTGESPRDVRRAEKRTEAQRVNAKQRELNQTFGEGMPAQNEMFPGQDLGTTPATEQGAEPAAAKSREKQGEMFTPTGKVTKAADQTVVESKPEPKPEPKPKTKSAEIKEKVVAKNAETRAKAKPAAKAKPKAETYVVPDVEELSSEYQAVLDEADTYLADDGESGLLKPVQYQQLSMLAEQGKLTPAELRERMEEMLQRNAEKVFGDSANNPRRIVPEGSAPYDPALMGKIDDAKAELRKRLDALGLKNVKLRMTKGPVSTEMGAGAGTYDPEAQMIAVAMAADNVRLDTLNHEVIHHLKNIGVFTDAEWNTLVAAARRRKRLSKNIDRDYAGLSKTERDEEAVAEMFAIWARGDKHVLQATGLLNRIKQFFDTIRQVFNKNGFKTAEDIFNAIESGEVGTREGTAPQSKTVSARVESLTGDRIERAVSKLPEALQEPAFNVSYTLADALSKGLTYAAFTEDLGDLMGEKVPASKDYFKAMNAKEVARERLNKITGDVVNMFRKLPIHLQNVGKGTVNGVIQDIDEMGAWAFEPTWLTKKGVAHRKLVPDYEAKLQEATRGGDAKAIEQARSELARAKQVQENFDRLPKAAKDAIQKVFEHEHTLLTTLKDVVTKNIGGTYEADIKAAEAAGDTKRVAELTKERNDAMTDYKRWMAIDESRPYASRRRYGDYIVVAKSRDLIEAAKDNANKKALEGLMRQERHYFVQRYSTLAEAKAAQRQIAKSGFYDPEGYYAGTADTVQDQLVGGKEMMLAFQRLRTQVQAMGESMNANPRLMSGLNRLVSDLYINSMRSTSARKSELKRLGVAGGDMDMMRNFVTQSRATAHLIAALQNNDSILDSMNRMGRQAREANDSATMDAYNEIVKRYMAGMSYTPSTVSDVIRGATSLYMLALKPFYYVQNLLQPLVLSAPALAGRHGYGRAHGALFDAYKDIASAWDGFTSPLDFDKLKNDDDRAVIEALADRGDIDIGAQKDLGSFHSLSSNGLGGLAETVLTKVRGATRMTEEVNRASTGLAAYRLAREGNAKLGVKPMTHEQAVEYAHKTIRTTHGSYDGFNAPRFMRSGFGAVATQFKKFQIMQLSLLARQMGGSLNAADPVERAVARRALRYTLAHTAVIAGGMGMPGMAALVWFLNSVTGNDDEPQDIEQKMRDAIGDPAMADLLLKGIPTVAGIDVSDRLGMGQALSLIPYVEPELSRSGYEQAWTALSGPFFGGLMPRMVDGLGLMREGDYYRGGEKLLPGIFADGLRAYREATEGVSRRNDDTLVPSEEVDGWQTLMRTFGLNTTEVSEQNRLRDRELKTEKFFNEKTSQLNKRFVRARKEGDVEEQTKVREEFRALQDARVKNGFKRQPLSAMLKYERSQKRRERFTVNGVQYQPNSPAYRAARREAMDQLDAEDEE